MTFYIDQVEFYPSTLPVVSSSTGGALCCSCRMLTLCFIIGSGTQFNLVPTHELISLFLLFCDFRALPPLVRCRTHDVSKSRVVVQQVLNLLTLQLAAVNTLIHQLRIINTLRLRLLVNTNRPLPLAAAAAGNTRIRQLRNTRNLHQLQVLALALGLPASSLTLLLRRSNWRNWPVHLRRLQRLLAPMRRRHANAYLRTQASIA